MLNRRERTTSTRALARPAIVRTSIPFDRKLLPRDPVTTCPIDPIGNRRSRCCHSWDVYQRPEPRCVVLIFFNWKLFFVCEQRARARQEIVSSEKSGSIIVTEWIMFKYDLVHVRRSIPFVLCIQLHTTLFVAQLPASPDPIDVDAGAFSLRIHSQKIQKRAHSPNE